MARSLLADAPFIKTTLTARVETGQWVTDPDTGNPVPETSDVTLTAFVSPDKARQLLMQPGADARLIPVRVELVKPLTLPAGVGLGSVIDLTWNGVPSKLTITGITPNDLVGVALGTVFDGEVTPA